MPQVSFHSSAEARVSRGQSLAEFGLNLVLIRCPFRPPLASSGIALPLPVRQRVPNPSERTKITHLRRDSAGQVAFTTRVAFDAACRFLAAATPTDAPDHGYRPVLSCDCPL